MKEVVDPLSEARRYVDNAKYVKSAGNYLWLAVM